MPVENGDRVRVDKLEEGLADVSTEVATLTGRFGEHIRQVANHRKEAIHENANRDRLSNEHHGEIMKAIGENAAELQTFNRLDKDRAKRARAGLVSAEFPTTGGGMPVGRKVAIVGGASLTGLSVLYVIVEVVDKVLTFFSAAPTP